MPLESSLEYRTWIFQVVFKKMHSNCPNHRRRNQEVERRLVSEACTLQNRCFMFRHSPHFPLSLALRWQVGFSIPPPEENLISTRPKKIVISSSRELFFRRKEINRSCSFVIRIPSNHPATNYPQLPSSKSCLLQWIQKVRILWKPSCLNFTVYQRTIQENLKGTRYHVFAQNLGQKQVN